ncbi:MAG: TetR/AcrR family transcriptional regulator [Ferruginibacter sp.]|nr:TetR/AcrR family transcriptional regulator [Cytophagales bacterium]
MQNTQQNIVDAAILVFNEDYSAPLEKVAEKAAVTRRTLHRYFKGRDELLASCEQEMQRSCNHAMTQALASSDNPLTQLENMLYAGVDCGAKYSFFSKLHTRAEHQHSPHNADCAEYDAVYGHYRAVITRLQAQGTISQHITAEWVAMLFSGVIAATINAEAFGSVAKKSLKQFAWFSFSKGIGI